MRIIMLMDLLLYIETHIIQHIRFSYRSILLSDPFRFAKCLLKIMKYMYNYNNNKYVERINKF